MNYPGLYNEELPKAARAWRRLSEKEKIRQIQETASVSSVLKKAQKRVERLEEKLGMGCEE